MTDAQQERAIPQTEEEWFEAEQWVKKTILYGRGLLVGELEALSLMSDVLKAIGEAHAEAQTRIDNRIEELETESEKRKDVL